MPAGNEIGDTDSIATLGDDLLAVSASDAAAAQQLAAQLRETGDWLDVVAGIDSVAVHVDILAQDLGAARRQLREQLYTSAPVSAVSARLVEIPVCYGRDYGLDLDAVCTQLNLSIEQLIALHTAGEYTVDMLGFTPGFAYVGGLPEELSVPRLEQPRQYVPAGSIGITDNRSGVYAMAGPGGWPLIGRTPITLFDATLAEPFILAAGDRVRFKAVSAEQFSALEKS